MPTDVTMPKWGMSMQEGQLIEWLVAEGDVVSAGQPIAVVETEKVNAEIEAPENGTVAALLVAAGTDVEVGTVIARLS
jgi:pyruvate/2-oxoglutarate dehydrogenase complex dihydrolipoamide acyltransferase (E2) component